MHTLIHRARLLGLAVCCAVPACVYGVDPAFLEPDAKDQCLAFLPPVEGRDVTEEEIVLAVWVDREDLRSALSGDRRAVLGPGVDVVRRYFDLRSTQIDFADVQLSESRESSNRVGACVYSTWSDEQPHASASVGRWDVDAEPLIGRSRQLYRVAVAAFILADEVAHGNPLSDGEIMERYRLPKGMSKLYEDVLAKERQRHGTVAALIVVRIQRRHETHSNEAYEAVRLDEGQFAAARDELKKNLIAAYQGYRAVEVE